MEKLELMSELEAELSEILEKDSIFRPEIQIMDYELNLERLEEFQLEPGDMEFAKNLIEMLQNRKQKGNCAWIDELITVTSLTFGLDF